MRPLLQGSFYFEVEIKQLLSPGSNNDNNSDSEDEEAKENAPKPEEVLNLVSIKLGRHIFNNAISSSWESADYQWETEVPHLHPTTMANVKGVREGDVLGFGYQCFGSYVTWISINGTVVSVMLSHRS